MLEKRKAKQQGGAHVGRKAFVWASSSGLQGNQGQLRIHRREKAGIHRQSCCLYPLDVQPDANGVYFMATMLSPALCIEAGREVEIFQIDHRICKSST